MFNILVEIELLVEYEVAEEMVRIEIPFLILEHLKYLDVKIQLLANHRIEIRIPTVKLKIPGTAFLKSESRTSVTFKL